MKPTAKVCGFFPLACLLNAICLASTVTQVSVPQRVKSDCQESMSLWSSCSKSCGLGISMRVSNANAECRLKRETRLCLVRPCGETKLFKPKHGRRCSKFRRSPKKVHVQYAGCQSVKRHRLKYCGLCLDKDRCCTPRNIRTTSMRFQCPSGSRFNKNVMVVMSCRCHRNCRPANALPKNTRQSYRRMPVES